MKSNWEKQLKAKGYTIDSLGNAAKQNINSYNELVNSLAENKKDLEESEKDLEELKQFEGQEGYDEKIANDLEQTISELKASISTSENSLKSLDSKITKQIENREADLQRAKKMQEARQQNIAAKKTAKEVVEVKKGEPKVDEIKAKEVAENVNLDEVKKAYQTDAVVEDKNKEVKEEKKSSGWGWFAALGVIALAVVGINVARNRA